MLLSSSAMIDSIALITPSQDNKLTVIIRIQVSTNVIISLCGLIKYHTIHDINAHPIK